MSRYAAIVLSAGKGTRMNLDKPKQYLDLLGKPVIYYSLKAFQDSNVEEIILVAGKDDLDYCRQEIVEKYGLSKVTAVVAGGKERYDSVLQGLRAVSQADYVMIHDGARPMLTQDMILRLEEEVERSNACVAAMPVKDTIKIVDNEGNAVSTPDRRTLWMIQTPQTFAYQLILQAYEQVIADQASGKPMPAITDDAMVVEYTCEGKQKIRMVEGSYTNLKITTIEDLDSAEIFLKKL